MSICEPEERGPASHSHERLVALGEQLKDRGYVTRMVAGGLVVRNPDLPSGHHRQLGADTIACRPYRADWNHYWFFTSWQQPIAEAERIPQALTVIKDYLGAPK
ncbi:hypothetical protein [Actinomadura litoris]|uniref:hypothetical protein n=1 Tax=Actinomadura litoris TaxID=2678616 RepID=UPI001FA761F6|nr:hypothetical protein [Actinomadura litoris]